jgi:hypothetical protein
MILQNWRDAVLEPSYQVFLVELDAFVNTLALPRSTASVNRFKPNRRKAPPTQSSDSEHH